MADVDFNINIRTIADTTGIKLTQQGLDALKVAALQGNQQAIASLQQLTNAQKGVAAAGAGNAAELGRLVGTFTGVGIAGGVLALVNGLKQASAEIVKIADELDKQGEMLVKHAQLQSEAARHAKDQDDVLKISSATLKDIESTQKKFNELSQKELSAAAKFSDYLQVQLLARQKIAGIGDYEAAHRVELETAANQAQSAREQGMREVLDAEKAINQTTEEHLATLDREIKAEEQRKAAAAANTDPGGYVKAANNLASLKKEFQDFIKLDEQERQKKEKGEEKALAGTSSQAKAILANEQAAQAARARGDEKAADQFQKSADEYRKSATPQQLLEASRLSKAFGVEGPPKTVEEWRKQQQKATDAFYKQQADETADPELHQINEGLRKQGLPPITKEEKQALDLKGSIDDLSRKFDKYWGP